MASTWADSWGASWLDSWARSAPAVVTPTVTTGGGRKRYPKRVMVKGRLYTVKSWDEELQLLQASIDRIEYQSAIENLPESIAQPIRKRLKKVESEHQKWVKQMRAIDDELLLLLLQ